MSQDKQMATPGDGERDPWSEETKAKFEKYD